MPNAKAEDLKAKGNAFFKGGQYAAAIEKYKEATAVDPNVPAYWSNMAACYEKLGKYEEMEEAGRSCIKADRSFVKGYFRLATAQKQLNDLDGCIKTLESGLAIQASNADLKKMKKEVNELQRGEQVAAYYRSAKDLYKAKDYSAAMKQLELANRLDAGNEDVKELLGKVKPKFDAQEKKRKAGLKGPDLYKEQGDEKYKAAQFEEAIPLYSKCIDGLKSAGKGESELMLKALSNRAACYKQISNFDGTIEDCTAVLEVDPENVKALIRRAQAFEGVERYRMALSDIKQVLGMPADKVGKQNRDVCNGLMHRLQRTVNQLKKMND